MILATFCVQFFPNSALISMLASHINRLEFFPLTSCCYRDLNPFSRVAPTWRTRLSMTYQLSYCDIGKGFRQLLICLHRTGPLRSWTAFHWRKEAKTSGASLPGPTNFTIRRFLNAVKMQRRSHFVQFGLKGQKIMLTLIIWPLKQQLLMNSLISLNFMDLPNAPTSS